MLRRLPLLYRLEAVFQEGVRRKWATKAMPKPKAAPQITSRTRCPRDSLSRGIRSWRAFLLASSSLASRYSTM